MSDLKTPAEWCRLLDIVILDPDGWRNTDGTSYDTPIDRDDFIRRALVSTCRMTRESLGLFR